MKHQRVETRRSSLLAAAGGLLLATLVAGCATPPPAEQAGAPQVGVSVAAESDPATAPAETAGAATKPPASGRDDRTTAKAVVTERDLGIKVTALRVAGSGATLELRFYLDDPLKGHGLFDRDSPPYLLDESTGATLATSAPPIPYGAGRTSSKDRGPKRRSYLLQFSGARQTARPGIRLSLVVGDVKLTGLLVE